MIICSRKSKFNQFLPMVNSIAKNIVNQPAIIIHAILYFTTCADSTVRLLTTMRNLPDC
jgi:hypothetical protein